MEFSMFYLPVIAGREEVEHMGRFAGQDRKLYQELLKDLSEQAKYIDKHGFHGLCFTEHHFHVEGYEVSTNPIMLGLYLGLQTKNLRIGQLGNVLPTHDPIRLAENLAILDQMLQGRAFAAFDRGYQERWVRTLAQKNNVGISNKDPIENIRNKEVFEDFFDIIQKAWKGGTFSHYSPNYHIPVPVDYSYKDYQEGLNEDGILEEVGIVPLPYQETFDLWHPFPSSESSIRWAAARGALPVIIHTDYKVINKLFDAYVDEANKHGYNRKRGERIALIRDVFVYDTEEEAKYWQEKGAGFIWKKWFSPDGFDASNLREGETLDQLTGEYDELVDREFCIVGTPEQVLAKIQNLVNKTGCQHLVLYNFTRAIPQEKVMRSLELFCTEVMPHLKKEVITVK
ncbi:LLM class flavin-dependent oxidoreductase [Ureibacillus endophyticus]|uniref:LLM class flavin-dependent oxidoreductase n=1 Tax=Ureibacillus endophyticus TaxID=1978490 RepID=A0A494YT11_9BACL|nr:LLM class flavin-dependent oxidoreductase [Lysinibacillus endophyticus]RKQ13239.1 LLM class flavin-dependent oxidoreductase [Lysinibacillus endophyticus]